MNEQKVSETQELRYVKITYFITRIAPFLAAYNDISNSDNYY
jgi:hypothetical protein